MNITNIVAPMKTTSVVLLFTAISLGIKAQNIITFENNSPRCDDITEKQQVSYVPSGDAGEGIVWDFSGVRVKNDLSNEFYCESDSTILFETTSNSINKYHVTNQELNLIGYETPYQSMTHNQPVLQVAYPFSYGQVTEHDYSGVGKYCNTKGLQTIGNVRIEADATGIMYLSDSDTVNNVTRIHSIRSGAIGMCDIDDTTTLVRENMKQEIEERYQWYARGYRYPIFETISISYYDNMDLVSCKQTAYRYLPDMQRQLEDEENEELLNDDNNNSDGSNNNNNNYDNSDIIHYNISVSGGTAHLTYDLSQDANITILVCNYMGCTFKHMSFKATSGEGLETDIDCSGLSPDIYVLYINVNGKIYNEKINLKH